MAEQQKGGLPKLPSGVPGLDEVLGGGFPEYSFNIVAGEPGSGKTTLVHQMLFANASDSRPALYFAALGESPLKMLRYQQQLSFFDAAKVGTAIRYVDLGDHIRKGDFAALLQVITEHVREAAPSVVVVDSFRSALAASSPAGEYELRRFLQDLAMQLASWQVTTFLVGEYDESEVQGNPLFTICDGLVWLFQARERNAVVRKLLVKKVRGQAQAPGIHTFRITPDGLRVFARTQRRPLNERRVHGQGRLSTGVEGLDEMMNGGIPRGDTVLLAGPTGVGKSLLSTHCIVEGLRRGEPAVVALFEEHPDDYVRRATEIGLDLRDAIASGQLRLVYLRAIDLSVDETIYELRSAIEAVGATRFVVDSLTALELALAPSHAEEFREALFRMVNALPGGGVTSILIVEVTESFRDLRFSPHAVSFMAEDIIMLRYVELHGELRKLAAVVKMRRSAHVRELREYEIRQGGLAVLAPLHGYRGLLTGVPELDRTSS
jgi:circadian clock protein KaiC